MANCACRFRIETLESTSQSQIAGLRRVFAGLALVLLFVPLAASPALVDPDEGLHAAIAQEMVARHDYVTPTFLGEPFLDKPILFFWAEALSLRLFGMNEIAVRIPPLTFGLLGMLAVLWLARELYGEPAGVVAGIVYGSMLLPLGVSQVAVHDIGLVPFMCAAMVCLLRAANSERAWLWGLPMGLCLGLSILTKGLVGVVFTGIFAMCLAVVRRDQFPRIAVALVVGGIVSVIVAMPWYLAMERAHPGYLRYYFIERHLRGYLTATQRHAGRPWWYYIPILIGGTLPWTGYFAGALGRRGAESSTRSPMTIVWIWVLGGLVFLSAGESKLVTYVLPLFPGLAIAIGEYLPRGWARREVGFGVGFALQTLVLAFLPCLAIIVLQGRYPSVSGRVWAAAIVTIPLALIACARAWRAARFERFVLHVGTAIAVTVTALIAFVAPGVVEWMTAKDLARALNATGRLPPRVIVVDERIGSLVFYLAPALRAAASPDRVLTSSRTATLERLRVEPDDSVVAVRDDELPRFQRLFAVAPQPESRAGTFSIFRVDRLRAALDRPR